MNLAKEIESGRKKAANKLNAKLAAIKATKGKTPTPVRLKQRYTFTDIKGKKREFVRKFAYDRALAKNKAERERRAQPTWSQKARWKRADRGQPFNMKTPQNVRNAIKAGKNMKFVGGRFKTVTPKAKTPTPKAKTPTPKAKTFVNKFVNALDKDELNALKKKIC
jgi:actin-related protein